MRAQLLDADRPSDLLAVVERLTFLQLDPTAVVAANADLVLWTGIGNSYSPDQLRQATQVDRTVWEHRAQEPDEAPVIVMLRPVTQLDVHRPAMTALLGAPGRAQSWLDANDGFRWRVLDQLSENGPLASKDILDTAEEGWQSTGWTKDRNVTQMLEFLASRGVVAVAGRNGKQRLWDLADRVYLPVDELSVDHARQRRNEYRLRALGVARRKWVGDAGIEVEIEGTPGVWRLDPEATADGFEGRTALLSPFDRLVHDYDRKRAAELFEFEFMIEFYKPKTKRRWGYFVMPVLHHDRLVGKIDVAADRQAGRLVAHGDTPGRAVHGCHQGRNRCRVTCPCGLVTPRPRQHPLSQRPDRSASRRAARRSPRPRILSFDSLQFCRSMTSDSVT